MTAALAALLAAAAAWAPSPARAGEGRGEGGRDHREADAHARRLVVRYQCGACHRIEGVSHADATASPQGPPLVGLALRTYIAGRLPNTPGTLARWIADPAALVPGTPMPAMGVSAADARAMAAWLQRRR